MSLPIAHRETGHGPALLLVHGAGEDAEMLTGQAEAFAARGYRVITYDRRGTGGSTRAGWPGGGVEQHADDAADLLAALDAAPATVLGFSSGGIVALALAARHPDVVTEVVAWEPPVITMLPEGPQIHAGLVAPIEDHLAAHPGDWAGAYRVLLGVTSGGEADLDSPAVRRQLVNAEAAVRDDSPILTAHALAPGSLPAGRVTIAVGADVNPLLGAIAAELGAVVGRPPLVVADAHEHEVYLSQPEVLAEALARR